MKAITFTDPGDEDVLTISTVADPELKPGEVLVDVAAAGVNSADLQQRRGTYPPPPGASPILGLEISGTIAAAGAGVDEWLPGDRVCAIVAGGGYAERVAVPVGNLLPVPDGVGLVDAAALPEAACTVFSNVGMIAGLEPGETLLVHGGASGMGSHAIQWASALGAHVIATAGSRAKLEAARTFGADVVINHRDEDFVERTLAATAGRGADVIFDIVGPSYLRRNIDALALDGRIAIIGTVGTESEAPLDIRLLLRKRGRISATTLRNRPSEDKAAIVEAVRHSVWPFVAAGSVAPVIDSVFPLADAAEAHRALAGGRVIGKLLLTL